MTGSRRALRLALACTVAIGVVPEVSASGNESPTSSAVAVSLTVDRDLPVLTNATLMREVETIWRAQSLKIEWRMPDDPVALRVIVVSHSALLASVGAREFRLGRLLRPAEGGAIAIVSIAAAAAIADRARDRRLPRMSPLEDRRLGLVLGRAVAHEIGHYVLDSASHAVRGLMRASIAAEEFGDLRPGSLSLDPTDKHWPSTGFRLTY